MTDNNVRIICTDCFNKAKTGYDGPLEKLVGKCVKLGIKTKEPSKHLIEKHNCPSEEHMWVLIKGIMNDGLEDLFFGTLNNHPIFACHLQFGDEIMFYPDEIEMVEED